MRTRLDAIVRASECLFAERGYDCTSISDIAAMARVSAGTVMYHFKSKDRLLAQLAQRHLVSLQVRCRAAVRDRGTGLDRVGGFVGAVFEHVRQRPDGWRIFFQDVAPERLSGAEALRMEVETARRCPVILLQSLIAMGIGDGTIGDCDPLAAATAVWAILMGFAWVVLYQDGVLETMADNAARCSRLLLAGGAAADRLTIQSQGG